jgi:hypothetical protein
VRETSHRGSGPVRIVPRRRVCQHLTSGRLVQSVRHSHESWTKFRGPLTTNRSDPTGKLGGPPACNAISDSAARTKCERSATTPDFESITEFWYNTVTGCQTAMKQNEGDSQGYPWGEVAIEIVACIAGAFAANNGYDFGPSLSLGPSAPTNTQSSEHSAFLFAVDACFVRAVEVW